jgi:hypothetical protein
MPSRGNPSWQPGVSGNPSGNNNGHTTRRKATREIFQAIKDAGFMDPLFNLAKISTESPNESTRASAAAALLGYCHPKLQSMPVIRFIENPIEAPKFTSVAVAEDFLADITVRLARGSLDLDFAESLSKMTVGWIQSQYAKQGIELKALAQDSTGRDTTIRIEGGLPDLPGTNITMPALNRGLSAAGLRARLLLGVPAGLRWCGPRRRLYGPAGASLPRLCPASACRRPARICWRPTCWSRSPGRICWRPACWRSGRLLHAALPVIRSENRHLSGQ